jgi:flagellar hook assembly protein FlgD
LPGGVHTVRWDGRDDSGTPARSGIYFVEARSGRARQTRRIVLLQ